MVKFDPYENIFDRADFRALSKGNQLYALARWNEARQNRELPRVNPPLHYFGETSTHKPRFNNDNSAISYEDAFNPIDSDELDNNDNGPVLNVLSRPSTARRPISTEGGLHSGSKKQKTSHPQDNSDLETINLSDIALDSTSTTSTTPPTSTSTMVGTRSQAAGGSQNVQEMEVEEGAAGAGTGGNAAADGGLDSAQGIIHSIPRHMYKVHGGTQIYKKTHYMRSLAFAPNSIVLAPNKVVPLPLCEIPWQYMYLYLSPDEFNLIPAGSQVSSVKVRILELSAQTGYITGGTLSTTAQQTHDKIGLLGFDLNEKIRGSGTYAVGINASNNMANSVLAKDPNRFINDRYGILNQASVGWDTEQPPGLPFGMVYNANEFFCVNQPTQVQALLNGYTTANAPNYEFIMSHISQFNMNDVAWSPVFEREYKFSSAPIGTQFRPQETVPGTVASNVVTQTIGKSDYYALQRTMTNTTVGGNLTMTESFLPNSYNNIELVDYSATPIEKGANNRTGSNQHKPARQPTLHYGMKWIPKIDAQMNLPRAADYVLAATTFVVEAEIVIQNPTYPNRFLRPKAYTTSFENARLGTGRTSAPNATVTFGLETDT
jgi:Capsid protein VP4